MYKLAKGILKLLDVVVIFVMAFGSPMSALAQSPAQDLPAPTIASDKADYPAGALVTLTGTGWTGDTTVTIVVADAAPTVYHDTDQVQVLADGTITDSFNLPTSFVDQYFVTATGNQTGRVATATFTDAPAAVNLDQCRNGSATNPNDCKDFGGNTGWVNGNVGASQAHMLEGYSTPFRAVMTNLPTGTAITLVIGYDIRNSGANAYDYLTQYQRLEPHSYFGHPAETVYPTDGVTGFSATTSTFPIPAPSSAGSTVAGQPTTEFNSLPAAQRVMTLFGGTISGMAYVSQGSLTANQSETQISVTFTVQNSTAVLAWGGHISECSVWGTTNGTCNSAGGISGSPYHMRLISWGPNLPNLGNTDRSMAAAVVVQPGNLTLAKTLTGGPSGYTGPFTIAYNCGTGYTGSVTVNAGSSQTVNGIPSGSVCTISETPPAPPTGYTFGTPTFAPSNNVTIGAGTTVTVTTNNTLTRDLGSLVLAKSLTGGPAGYTGPFTINYDCGTGFTGSVSVAAGSSQTVSGIPTGTSCTVSETPPTAPTGYTFGTPTFSPDATVTIPAGSGSSVTVTTNNTLTSNPGSLKLAKSLTGGPQGYTGPFTINYDCGAGFTGSVSVAAGDSQTIDGIPSGSSCTISETPPTAPTGYSFGTPTFDPPTPVTIGSNQIVTVTTNNTLTRDLGSLVLAKSLTGGPSGYSGPFTINYDCGTGFTGSVSVAAGSSQTVSGIPTGTSCTVSETPPTAPTGYTFGTPTFSPDATVTIPSGNGSSVTVTTNNTLTRDTGSLKILKAVDNPDGAPVPASFLVNYDCGGSYAGQVSVAPGSPATVNGIPTGSTCSVTEVAPVAIPGFTWGPITYTPASVTIDTKGQTFTITVGNSITRDRGSLQILKTVDNPDGAPVPASFTVNYDCGSGYTGQVSVAPNSPATVNGIPTGNTCTVSEPALTPIPGYTWGTPTVTPASVVIADTTSTFTLTVANSITRDRGSLTIAKTLSNPDGATLPASFTVNYNCGTGYTGSVSVAAGGSQTVSGIPTGNTCTVSEPALTPIPGYTWGTPTVTPASVVIADTTSTFTLTVANSITRDRGSLEIDKTLSNPDGAPVPASFAVNYDCGAGYTGQVSVAQGSPTTVNGIPTGSTCTVTEVAPAAIPGYTWGDITYTPASVVISTKGQTFTITVGNSITRDRGSLEIDKTLSNPDGAPVPASFTVNYDCGTGYTGQVSVGPGSPATVNGIPTGNTCTVTEVAPTPIPGYTWGTITYTPASVVISTKSQTFSIAVGNSITRDRGSLTIAKTLSNPDNASVPASFTINYDCGSGYTGSVSVAAGGSQIVSGIPTGNTCMVSEPALTPIPGYTWGAPTVTPASVVIADTTSTFTITVANSITRDRGSLEIDKTLSNPDGATTLPSIFTVAYNCGNGYAATVGVVVGTPAKISGIPTGSTCSVTEVAPTPIDGYTWGTVTYTPASVVIGTKDQTFTITVGNSITRDRGSLKITKNTSNPDGATLPAAFTGTYDCGGGYTGPFSVANGASQTISGIPTGSTCTVTELAPAPIPGYTWGTVTYIPASVVISTKGGTFEIVVGNSITRDRGSLEIDKTVSNPDGATLPASFTVNYNCGTGYTGQVSVAPGSPATVNAIPTGNTCTVTEVQPATIPGYTWGTITYTPASVVISTKGQTFSITVGNSITRDRGSLVLAKKLTGGPSGYTGPFTIGYDCGTGFQGSVTVNAGSSQTISGIPTGTSCIVSETPPTAPTGYTFGTPTFSPSATVSIPAGNGSSVTVTTNNTLTRDTGSLKIIKTVTGASFSGTFSVHVACTGDGGSYDRSITYPTPGYVTIDNIPTGNDCTVTEPTFPTPPAGYVWGTPTITGSPATISKGTIVEVTVANILQTGHAQVVKTVGGQPISATNNCMDVSGNIVGCTFQLRQGASTTLVGTTLETLSTLLNGQPVGTLNFTTKLTPGQTYQMCEIVMPGWLTSLGTFVPNSFIPPDGVAPNPAVDNSILCGNFVAQADTATTVGNVFTIDNTPPPGGRGLTIGFWKNWASCTTSSTNKKAILDETLAKAMPGGVVVSATSGTYPVFGPIYYLVLHGSTTTPKVAPDCKWAVNLLNKTTIDGKKKMASDPAFNLAAQLVAAELNYAAGAGKKPAVTAVIQQAVLLLGKYQFNGLTHKTISAADATTMNNLATILDNYNNNRP